MSLFEKLGRDTIARIDALEDASKILLEGLAEDESGRIGYLGFYGSGEHGLDTPAFLVKPPSMEASCQKP